MPNNIHPHEYKITTQDIIKKQSHKPGVIWLTGLSGSGKSTVANVLNTRLFNEGIHTYVLDGDNIRSGLNSDLGFSPGCRKENIRRISEVANLFADAGILVITAFISPYREDRQLAKDISKHAFFEVHVDCNLEVCEQRDPKGLYKKVRAGVIKNFTGIDAPYEKPQNPDVVIKTDSSDVGLCVEQIINCLQDKKILSV
jgi:adenylylsulfate kinase